MALIGCPRCEKEISDRGKICPHCKLWLDMDYLARKKEEIIAEGERQYRETREYKTEREEEDRISRLPFCPICGKKESVERISTMNRTASVLMFGLASSKIGKQYICRRCKPSGKTCRAFAIGGAHNVPISEASAATMGHHGVDNLPLKVCAGDYRSSNAPLAIHCIMEIFAKGGTHVSYIVTALRQ